MAKKHMPASADEVFDIMKQYVKKKGFNFSNSKIRYLAEDCFLYWESRKWDKVAYWPAVAMRWVLTNLDKQVKGDYKSKHQRGKSVRDIIMEQENE